MAYVKEETLHFTKCYSMIKTQYQTGKRIV